MFSLGFFPGTFVPEFNRQAGETSEQSYKEDQGTGETSFFMRKDQKSTNCLHVLRDDPRGCGEKLHGLERLAKEVVRELKRCDQEQWGEI